MKGSGSTEKKAKIDAAIKMMREIKKATEEGRTLGDIPNKKLLACCRWLVSFLLFSFQQFLGTFEF